ncbi:3-dehydroquinate synthase [Sporomusa rhizae]|uniref:3-dehydroquinate synthase n=1 Tax=Sporomusa rhizae TaxID=357999 RepID=UPI00352BB065
MAEVRVELETHSYTIHITAGGISRVGALMRDLFSGDKALIVTDENVYPLYAERLVTSLTAAGFTPAVITVPAGESSKSLVTSDFVYTKAITMGLDRKSPLIALGGGVVGDLAGFVAATYLRGVPFIQVPTTLLAQVDSSVGGKTAVNHALGKNLIGTFYQPGLVVIDTEALQTLPARELKAGLAEVVKYGVITDYDFLSYLKKNTDALLIPDLNVLTTVIAKCCQIKAGVVAQDEREDSLRMMLNFGHTVGHAVEAVGGYSEYNHGEAVAVGMHAAALISQRIGLCRQSHVDFLRNLLSSLGLPLQASGYLPKDLLSYLARDKKVVNGKINWVLMSELGQVTITREVSQAIIMEILSEITI